MENAVAAELTKYAIWLLSPLGLWIALTAMAGLGLFGRRQWRARIMVLAQLQLLAFSLPWVGDTLLGQLEDEALVMEANRPLPPNVDAIVVLGGGLEGRYDGVRALPDLNDAGDRVWQGARLYKQGVAPRMVLSGGLFQADPRKEAEAPGMKIFMLDMGVPENALVIEGNSRTTFENALRTRELLGEDSSNIALVTSAFHMGRSVLWFEKAGFTVYPVRTDIRVLNESRAFWEWLPKPQALDESTIAIKEYLGRLQLKVSGAYETGGSQ
ncbi:MAG: YdcF family protein [Limnobacter sp.]|uniref:YdcF family protein n=1 Tax=Limnobacter sp. TaxID=2003368 RepID=UPI00403773B5